MELPRTNFEPPQIQAKIEGKNDQIKKKNLLFRIRDELKREQMCVGHGVGAAAAAAAAASGRDGFRVLGG